METWQLRAKKVKEVPAASMAFSALGTVGAEKLSFGFTKRKILDAVDFCLRPASITCLLGGNGAGKTTLFNLITGFLRPDSGSLWYGHETLIGPAPYQISRLGVARTFQDLRLIGNLTVLENILLAIPRHPGEQLMRALLPACLNRAQDAESLDKADHLLAEFFLANAAGQLASKISYGQQKLLTLACCAAMDAGLLLLDEPVAGISPEYQERITNLLRRMKDFGKTILLIEHQPDFLDRTGDKFLVLQAGRLYPFSTMAELRAAPISHDALA